MSVIVVKRPPRAVPPGVPTEPVRLESPPELPRGQDQGLLTTVLPLIGMACATVFFLLPGTAPFMKVMGGLMAAATGFTAVALAVRVRRGPGGQLDRARRDYFAHLARVREQVRRTARAQRAAQLRLHPSPDQLWSVVADSGRLWERRAGDADFGQIRVGFGPQRLATPLIAPTASPQDGLEPLTADALRRFLAAHASLDGLPVAVSLRTFPRVTVSGDPEAVYGSTRAMLAQLAAAHSPEDLVVAVAAGADGAARWDWTKWLPHNQLPGVLDGAGTRRLFCGGLAELEELLAGHLAGRPPFDRGALPLTDRPHVVVVLDGAVVPAGSALASAEGLLGVTVVDVAPGGPRAPRTGMSIVVRPGRMTLESRSGKTYEGQPDALSPVEAEALARQLAPLRLGADGGEPLLAELDFTDLPGLGDAGHAEVARIRRPRSARDRLRVPFAVGGSGEPVVLDLKDVAEGGMGPHGLCVGDAGSGKSELLRTLVLALAATHSSETLNLVLADSRGGGTFAGMSALPHVAAILTGPAGDPAAAGRMRGAITGELQRRRELLRSAGDFADIHAYERARAAGSALEPLPSTLFAVDDFDELVAARPEFADLFLLVGRTGGPLGVHLLLASRRPQDSGAHGLDGCLTYRMALRTGSEAQSHAVLGVPDAFHLPPAPGSGYLKSATEGVARFKAAYVSGAHEPSGPRRVGGGVPAQRRPVVFSAARVAVALGGPDAPEPPAAGAPRPVTGTVLDAVVRRLEGRGPAAHRV